ncbi:amidophosphoribosyltransferase [Natranaerobius trueperi]|uniref:Amidophosphoribosyltransferase n=2 Tax=Natranaerobius trueperi TaxID=759412 RepID=A0A226C343_9FIRM|nr:amidophosphoribosyltransferase [Natranaerobius trueperi]
MFAPEKDVQSYIHFGLYALQHRGQESAGISISDGSDIKTKKKMGLVSEVFQGDTLENLSGYNAIGHVRYSTEGDSSVTNAQPLTITCKLGKISIVHNGNLKNAKGLRKRLEEEGTIFQTTTDSEILAHLLAKSSYNNIIDGLKEVASMMKGGYTFLLMTTDRLIAFRDAHGFRPLSLGKVDGGYVLSSETCAFDTIGAEYVRDISPGEMVVIDKQGITSTTLLEPKDPSLCIFEYIYFARPDSNLIGKNVHLVRKELGKELAKESNITADIVSGVPDSSLSAASGVAEALNLPYEMGLIKNRYIGRTFIKPNQEMRELGVQVKLNPVNATVFGKRIILVDDSIVRGTTITNIIKTLRDAGAKEVHILISSPPVKFPCYYGIDTSSCGELIASKLNVEEIRTEIGADSLQFLSIQGMVRAVERVPGLNENTGYCLACFNGEYPVTEED